MKREIYKMLGKVLFPHAGKKQFSIIAALCLLIVTPCKQNSAAPRPLLQAVPPQIVYDTAGRLEEIIHSGANTADAAEKYIYMDGLQYRHFVAGVEPSSVSPDYTLNATGRANASVSSYYNSCGLHEYNRAGYISCGRGKENTIAGESKGEAIPDNDPVAPGIIRTLYVYDEPG